MAPLAITQRRRFGEVPVIGVIGALLAIGIRGGLLLDESPTSLRTFEPWRVAVLTRFGASALVPAVGALLIAIAWRRGRPARVGVPA